jgi:hypothetical protein
MARPSYLFVTPGILSNSGVARALDVSLSQARLTRVAINFGAAEGAGNLPAGRRLSRSYDDCTVFGSNSRYFTYFRHGGGKFSMIDDFSGLRSIMSASAASGVPAAKTAHSA